MLVIDEGHELVDRVTSTITDEVTPGMVRAAAKRAGRQADSSSTMDEAADLLESVLEPAPEGRLTGIPDSLAMALGRVRDTARAVQSELKPQPGRSPTARVRWLARRRRGLRERLADPRGARARRRLAEPRPAPRPGAARGADERRDARARQGLLRAAPSS